MTPLIIAAQRCSIEVVKTLLADGRSNPQARDKNNLCALDYAREQKINAQNNFVDPDDRRSPSKISYEADAIITLLESSYADHRLALPPISTDSTRAKTQATWNVKKRIRFCCYC
jgi:ankyrin repeat protein